MFNQSNSKKRGDAGVGSAIAWFTINNYTVSIPLTDSQDYDLIVEKDNLLYKCQVKTTSYKKKNGIYAANLTVKGGNRSGSGKIKHFDKDKVDLLFVLTDSNVKYLIPSDCCPTAEICLGDKYRGYIIT